MSGSRKHAQCECRERRCTAGGHRNPPPHAFGRCQTLARLLTVEYHESATRRVRVCPACARVAFKHGGRPT